LIASLQRGGGVAHVPLEQYPLLQSLLPAQAFCRAQGLQLPPQSTSLSVPLCKPSSQLAAAHTLLLQMPLTQSLALRQTKPLAQLAQLPPQSTSLSEPFLSRSLQLAGAIAHMPLEHRWLAQS
jgi:hypothetical protein